MSHGIIGMALEGQSLSIILKVPVCLKETCVNDQDCMPADVITSNRGIY